MRILRRRGIIAFVPFQIWRRFKSGPIEAREIRSLASSSSLGDDNPIK
jgi:hypothetical protein